MVQTGFQIKCPYCSVYMNNGCDDARPNKTPYKLLCPLIRENLAVKVLREKLTTEFTDIDLDCPYMREARNTALEHRQRPGLPYPFGHSTA
jgi:hypothetical protein